MSPRYSTGAYGFGSQLSWWAMPPGMKMWMTASAFGSFFAAGGFVSAACRLHPEESIERQPEAAEEADVHERPAGQRRAEAIELRRHGRASRKNGAVGRVQPSLVRPGLDGNSGRRVPAIRARVGVAAESAGLGGIPLSGTIVRPRQIGPRRG